MNGLIDLVDLFIETDPDQNTRLPTLIHGDIGNTQIVFEKKPPHQCYLLDFGLSEVDGIM